MHLKIFSLSLSRLPAFEDHRYTQSSRLIVIVRLSVFASAPSRPRLYRSRSVLRKRTYSRGGKEKKGEEEKPREESSSFVHVCWIRARPLSGLSSASREGRRVLSRLSLALFPSILPSRRFLRSEACVRVSPSFPFIATLASAHSSASPSSASS